MTTTIYKGVKITQTKEGFEVTKSAPIIGSITNVFDSLDKAKAFIDRN